MKTYYFMSGLPRSGSSLLSAIFNQNSKFYCGPSSPSMSLMLSLEKDFNTNELYHAYPKEEFKKNLIASALYQYYDDVDKPIIVDKNRSWTHRLEYIEKYFDVENPKVICTVRDLDEILTSFITMIHRSKRISFIDKALMEHKVPINDFHRCQYIAADGPLGRAYTGLQTAFKNGFGKNIHLVEYNDLVNNPKTTMDKIYEFLGEETYEHNFTNLKNVHQENDEKVYGLPDMHDVRKEISSISKDPKDVLPQKVLDDVKDLEFWKD